MNVVERIRLDHIRMTDAQGDYCQQDDLDDWPCDTVTMIEAYDAASELAANSVNEYKVAVARQERLRLALIDVLDNMDADSAPAAWERGMEALKP